MHCCARSYSVLNRVPYAGVPGNSLCGRCLRAARLATVPCAPAAAHLGASALVRCRAALLLQFLRCSEMDCRFCCIQVPN